MKIHKNAKIEKACRRGITDEACFPQLKDIAGGVGTLIAANGFVIVEMPVICDGKDEPGLIPTEAIKAARAHVSREKEADGFTELVCRSRIDVPLAGQTHDRPSPTGSLFGDHEFAMPRKTRNGQASLEIDPHLLVQVADAMGARRLLLRFVPGNDGAPIRVDPAGECWAEGTVAAIAHGATAHEEPVVAAAGQLPDGESVADARRGAKAAKS